MNTNTYKKLISIFMAVALITSASAFAFADDDSASVPEDSSGTAAELSEAENEFLSKSTSESDFEVRKAIINSVRSVAPPTGNETASDIYELLYSCWTSINLHYSLYVYDDQNYSVNNDIRTAINAIVSSLQGTTESATGDVWNLLKQIVNALTLETNSNVPGDYTIHHNVDLISQFIASGLFDSNQNPFLQGISSNLTTVSANLASQMNQIIVIRNKIDSIESNVDYIEGYAEYISEATEMVIVPRIEHIDDDLHDIRQWLDDTFYDSSYTYNYIDIPFYNPLGDSNNSFRAITLPEHYFPNDVYTKVIVPINYVKDKHLIYVYDITGSGYTFNSYTNSNVNICATTQNTLVNNRVYGGTVIYNCPVEMSILSPTIMLFDVYIDYDLSGFNYLGLCKRPSISIISSSGTYIDNQPKLRIQVLVKENVLKHIDNDLHLGYDILNTFKELYASDDLINAKENQQELEDSVLDDFTGSGSASASVSDAVDIKGVQSSLKGSLDTGDVNASGLSTILNTSEPTNNKSFFKFWTQDVYNDINGVNNIPQMRGGNSYVYLNDSEQLDELIRSQSW